jgi:pyruvate/2-oxoglutarate dehydrogenase complex dihydrolipoamide acyltransferase (E2) component
MPSSRNSPSPEVAALRAAAEASVRQLRDDVREQASRIRSGAAGALTEADVERMAEEVAAAARARLEAAAPPAPSPSADPELAAIRRQAAALLTAAAREADAVLRRAWRAGPEEAPGGRRRPWRRQR